MSNTLALATLTAVLEGRISALINSNGLAGMNVSTQHPRGESPSPGVYLQPYRVAPSAALRNSDLPTRRPDGSVCKRPRLAIEIDLMISFVGEPTTYDAERLAGLVMTDLHARPTLSPTEINDFLAGVTSSHVLAQADLGDQLELVKLGPLSLSLEDLTRVWGMLGQSFYGLSVAYRASVILLDSEVTPSTALPVVDAQVETLPRVIPRISSLRSSARDQPVVTLGEQLIVEGVDLRGSSTWVQLGETAVEVDPAEARNDRLSVTLDASLGLRAGIQAVSVLHRAELGPAADPLRTIMRSNPMPLALVPTVTPATPAVVAAGSELEIHLEVEPLPADGQQVQLLLNPLTGTGASLISEVWSIVGDELVFTLPTPASGEYLVRVSCDGASSLLSSGATGLDGPKVVVP